MKLTFHEKKASPVHHQVLSLVTLTTAIDVDLNELYHKKQDQTTVVTLLKQFKLFVQHIGHYEDSLMKFICNLNFGENIVYYLNAVSSVSNPQKEIVQQ